MPTFYGPELVTNGEFTDYGTVDYDFAEYGVYYVDDIPGWNPISGHPTELLKGWTVGYDWAHNDTNRLQSIGSRTTGWTSFMEIESDLIDLADYSAGIEAGVQEFLFDAWYSVIGDDASHPDELRIKFYYLDVDENILSTLDTGVYNTYGGGWHQLTEQRVPPSGTRYAKIYIWSNQVYGFTPSNVFDSFSLRAVYDSEVLDAPTTPGVQIHPHDLTRDPLSANSATTEAAGYEVENLRVPILSAEGRWRSTGTTAVYNGDYSLVDARVRHAHTLVVLVSNLLPDDTIRVEAHNGGASIYDHTFTVPQNPDTDVTIWQGEPDLVPAPYEYLFFPFGEDILAAATRVRITFTTTAPNTYVEVKFFLSLSISFDRNSFYERRTQKTKLPIAAAKEVNDVMRVLFGVGTRADWRKVEFLNRELGISEYFCITLEPEADTMIVEKEGISCHRTTYYGHLAALIETLEHFTDIESFEMLFRKEM